MEENLVSKLKDYSKLSFVSKLKLYLEENQFERFAKYINTKESLILERIEPYSRKGWLR